MVRPCVPFILLMSNMFILYVVNGTTGEGVSMTVDERKKTAEVWKKATDGKYIYIYTSYHKGTFYITKNREGSVSF